MKRFFYGYHFVSPAVFQGDTLSKTVGLSIKKRGQGKEWWMVNGG
jgi:hypothetical protein